MEENRFEKQVQQKMDELKIHPSDSVWEKIEVRLEKKKRSNRGLFFLLLFCVFLTGSYLLWNINHRSIKEGNNSEKNNSEKNNNKNNSGKATSDISLKENKTRQVKKNLIPGSINPKNDAVENVVVKKDASKNSSQQYKGSTVKRIVKTNSGEKAAIVLSKQQKVTEGIYENSNRKPGVARQPVVQSKNEKINDEKINAEIKDVIYNKVKESAYGNLNKDSLSKPSYVQAEKEKVKDTIKKIPTSPGIVKHLKKSRWRPGILFSGGISNASNSFLNEDKSLSFTDPNSAVSGPGMSTPQPSATKAGFGFMIGIFAEKNIFPKAKVQMGIGFKSFNTSNKVGTRNDTTGFYGYQALYTSANTYNVYNTYSNHYNFIELPVTLKVQIGRGKNLPLFWQGGFTVSELISSNALQFNQSPGYYYNNNSIFNKTQIGLNTAISIALFSKQKNSVLIGPYFYYDASSLANEGLYNKKHFTFTALRAEIIFGK